MKKLLPVFFVTLTLPMQSSANFFDDIVKAVEKSAKDTTTNMAVQATAGMVRDMFIGYSSEQTKSDQEVAKEMLLEQLEWDGPVFEVSAATGEGTEALGQAIMQELESIAELAAEAEA